MSCSPGMAKCKIGCRHRECVYDYRAERERQETAMEEATGLHATEVDEYKQANEITTFKQWLKGRRRHP